MPKTPGFFFLPTFSSNMAASKLWPYFNRCWPRKNVVEQGFRLQTVISQAADVALLLMKWFFKPKTFLKQFFFWKCTMSDCHHSYSQKINIFLNFPACFWVPIFFSNLNHNCSNLLDMRNLQEQVKKAFCYQKLFWPLTAWINCSRDLKHFANSWLSA